MQFLAVRGQAVFIPFLMLCWATLCPGMPDPNLREFLSRLEASRQTGGRLLLTEEELLLNDKLLSLKAKELAAPAFPPAMHFFKAKPLIQSSGVFGLLQKMPKGAALHVHDFALVDADWLVRNVTYRPNCYVCFTDDQSVQFLFSSGPPKPRSHASPWVLLKSLRHKLDNSSNLDHSLIRNLTLFTEDPEKAYPTQDIVWKRFEQVFLAAYGLVTYAPVFKDYFYEALRQFYVDNVMYIELRALLPETYELDGRVHDKAWCLQAYKDVARDFAAHHPGFFGARVIFTVHRGINASEAVRKVQEAMKLQQQFPEIMAGFDFVGREDTGRSLWYFREALSLPEEQGMGLPYFFHAGETDLEGTEIDQNLLDALLFNTSRIGHGFALARHPVAKALSRKMDVPLEVCPISNQVLMLVSDLRNHPAAVLMSEGHPLVISSDDPAVFGAAGLSYDFYQAFVGLGGNSSNIGTLKELAMNSIRYSSLPPPMKEKALALWQIQWDFFVKGLRENGM